MELHCFPHNQIVSTFKTFLSKANGNKFIQIKLHAALIIYYYLLFVRCEVDESWWWFVYKFAATHNTNNTVLSKWTNIRSKLTAGRAKKEIANTAKQEATIFPIQVSGTLSPYPIVITVIWKTIAMQCKHFICWANRNVKHKKLRKKR